MPAGIPIWDSNPELIEFDSLAFGAPAIDLTSNTTLTGVVGVSEACSGVRSLQGALMVSVILGEVYRFSALQRGVLLVGSLALALCTNIVRATFLAWNAARAGLTVNERAFRQLCATAPYVEAMVGRLRRDPEFHEEPASTVSFD